MAYRGGSMRGAGGRTGAVFVRVLSALTALLIVVGLVMVIGNDRTGQAAAGTLVAARAKSGTPAAGAPSPTENPPDAPRSTLPDDYLAPIVATKLLPPPPPPAVPPAHRPVKVMVIGDSVAKTMVDAVVGVTPPDIVFQNEGILGCGVVQGGPFTYFGASHEALPQCEAWQQTWQAAVDRDHPDLAMILIGRWELMNRKFQGRWTHVGDPAFDAYLASEIETSIRIASSTGARVAMATTPYYHRGDRADGGEWPEDEPARVDKVNGLIRAVAARHPGQVVMVDVGARLSPEGHLAMDVGGVKLRSDGVHISNEAGPWLGPWLFPQLLDIADHRR